MIRDPLYRRIIERLEGQLNPSTFQDCANALLMEVFPTLAPMRGGDDEGMDGAIGHAGGDPSPIIATTAKNALRNLRGSLNARIASGSPNRTAVFATSRALTNAKKRNLHKEAERQGFRLTNVYDQPWFALKLYRNSVWRQELLGLAGDPPALSAIPISVSSSPIGHQVGREEEIAALLSLDGDRLLLGQPGSGKSFLLGTLALQGQALFAVSQDQTAIANALREHEEIPMVVVDDVQTAPNQELLRSILQLRNDIRANFHLCALSWPGREATLVQEMMGIESDQVLELGPLTIDEIVEILSEIGIAGPRWLISEIVQQAQGWPGLATTLASACLFGSWEDVVSGRRLEEAVLSHVERKSTEMTRAVLASLAIGGDAGTPISSVAAFCGISVPEVLQLLSDVESSGVIRESRAYICIVPTQLRYGLVRDMFYSGARSMDPTPLIQNTPDIRATTDTLIGAAARGAPLPPDFLYALVAACDDDVTYEGFAWLGEEQARWVIANVPGKLLTLADAGLRRAPRTYIPLLLQSAVGDERELHATPAHPLRKIQDWIGEAVPQTGEAVGRRRTLLDAVAAYMAGGGDELTCIRALPLTMAPRFERTFMNVGSELKYTHQFGYLSCDEIEQLWEFWPECLERLQDVEQLTWPLVLDLLYSWAHPLSMRGELSDEQAETLREHARAMLVDLVPLAEGLPAIAQKLTEIAHYLQVEVDLPLEREFAVLFPERGLEDRRDWREADRQEAERVQELAEELSREGPEAALERLAAAERQAALVDRKWPRWTPYAASIIAGQAENPLEWLATAIDVGLPADIAGTFLYQAADANVAGWADEAQALLENEDYRGAVIGIALRNPQTPDELLDRVVASLDGYERVIDLAIVRDEVASPLVSRLLRHTRPAVAIAAAEGVWARDRNQGVSDEIRADWENAVLEHGRDQYWVAELLSSDAELAFRWAERVLREDEASWKTDDQLRAAVGVLGEVQRAALLGMLSPTYRSTEAVRSIVGDSDVVFDALLCNQELQSLHLIPLGRKPGRTWKAMSLTAVRHGYGPEVIAEATFGLQRGMMWSGNESDMWKEWIDGFHPYCQDEDPGIRDIAQSATRIAESRMTAALVVERQERVHGIFMP